MIYMEAHTLSKRINQQRKDQGLTSEQLAELCGVNAVHIRKIESSGGLPSFALFIRLCNTLKTSADLLLGGLLDKPLLPDCVKRLGKQLGNLTPFQLEMLSEMIAVMIRHVSPADSAEKEAFGKRINQLRVARGLTSVQLGGICEVSAPHIRQIENDSILPSFTLFIKICNALGTSADFLLGDYLENSVIPDSAERLGIQFKHLTPAQIEMVSDMASVMIRYADKESG
jgi:transcriptional regulator with XRE-family HTH domain